MSFLDFGGGLDFGQGIAPPPPPPPPPPMPNIGPQGGQGSGIGSGLGLGGLGQQQGSHGGQGGGVKALDQIRNQPPAIQPPQEKTGQGNSWPVPGGGSASLSAMTPGQASLGQPSPGASPRPQDANVVPGASLEQRVQAKYQDVVRQLETSGGKSKSQHLGGASNQFQFTPDTRARFQPPGSDWNDPHTQVSTLDNETAHNRTLLQNSLGRDPSDSELWLAHNQGFHGANQMLRFPDQSPTQLGINPRNIVANVPGGVNANAYPNAPSKNFTSMWDQHYNRTAQQVGSAPGGGGSGKDQPVPTRGMHNIGGDAADIGGAEGAISSSTGGAGTPLDHPYRYEGTIKVGDQVFDYASGGAHAGSSPPGDQTISGFTPGAQRAAEGHSYTKDAFQIESKFDPALGRNREGVLIHSGHNGADVHHIVTSGCFAVPSNEWPALESAINGKLNEFGGHAILRVGANGNAEVLPPGSAQSSPSSGTTPQGFTPGFHVQQEQQKEKALAGPEQAYRNALNTPLPPPTPVPDIKGYVENWRQQHNQDLFNGQALTFKGIWLGIMHLGAGMLNGAFGHSSTAVGGFGNFSEGLYRGDKRQAQQGLADLKEGIDAMIKQYDLADRQRSEILENRNTDISTKLNLLKLEAAKNGDKQMAEALDRQDLQKADEIQFKRQKTILDLQEKMSKADELSKKWAWDENFKEKEAQQKNVDKAQSQADKSMRELMNQSAKMAEAIMKGGDEKAKDLIQQNIDMAVKRRNEALAKLQSARDAQAGQAPVQAAAPAQGEQDEQEQSGGRDFKRTVFSHELGDMVKQKDGSVWLYKGTGDRSDKASYEQIE